MEADSIVTGNVTGSPRRCAPEVPTNPRAMATVTALFFMWGLLTCLNDILVPHLKAVFELNYVEAMLI